jgi:hypothetical protein
MHKTTTAALAARLDVLSVAVQEVARALAPAQVAQVAGAVRERVAEQAVAPMSSAADEAITVELAPLLAALRATGA